ncbi:conserved hypothetical protein [Bacillus mycoides]|uniref:Uncharacterized protein n=1 Tax=Bacillus mycoides TaxID=1405 RepID=A0A653ZG20_BACMY|nr:conserved hypothetical protein [Bacillus mycoides]
MFILYYIREYTALITYSHTVMIALYFRSKIRHNILDFYDGKFYN